MQPTGPPSYPGLSGQPRNQHACTLDVGGDIKSGRLQQDNGGQRDATQLREHLLKSTSINAWGI